MPALLSRHLGHAEFGDDLFGRGDQRVLVGDARLVNVNTIGKAGEFLGGLFFRERTAGIDRDAGTGLGKRFGKLRSQLAKTAGHDRNLAFDAEQILHRVPLVVWIALRGSTDAPAFAG